MCSVPLKNLLTRKHRSHTLEHIREIHSLLIWYLQDDSVQQNPDMIFLTIEDEKDVEKNKSYSYNLINIS